MTETSLSQVALTRPALGPSPGRLDHHFYDLVETRFRQILREDPAYATFAGIHREDHRLSDATRDAVEARIGADRAHLAAVEAIDPTDLSEAVRFERDLEIHNLRLRLFNLEVHRVWERRSTAMDSVGDALFAVFARDFAPLDERLESLTSRLEDVPAHLEQHKTRAARPQVRTWQALEINAAEHLPSLIDEIAAAGGTTLADPEQRRLEQAAERAAQAVRAYRSWLEGTLQDAVEDWPLGREAYEELIRLRRFEGLDSDAILEIGERQLAENKAARTATAREIDPSVSEAAVVERVKADHPPTFDAALGAYREVMVRARSYLIEHDLVTVPDDERIEVLATPEYLRAVVPFAAYFDPPKFDVRPEGLYIVTPSVDDDPNAMLEHNWSSISNTSIHEAYPGHHLQLAVAGHHPSLTRFQTQAPEFVEGWGMYSEQMMREQGFDAGPSFRLNMYTDAIWRACRIILDVRMHRGEVTTDQATRFLVENTGFEQANARAEARRYTYTPTYQLSYLLGKVLLLQLRSDEQRRLGAAFKLRDFHDTLLRNGSLPISFHRRLLHLNGSPDGSIGDGARGAVSSRASA